MSNKIQQAPVTTVLQVLYHEVEEQVRIHMLYESRDNHPCWQPGLCINMNQVTDICLDLNKKKKLLLLFVSLTNGYIYNHESMNKCQNDQHLS